MVVERLVSLGITSLYVSADGPKNPADAAACEAARKACTMDGLTLTSNYSDVNLGCKNGVIAGLDWFFSLEEQGMVLEDDCLPNAAFIHFCQELLVKYANEPQVYMVGGHNPMGHWHSSHSHHFARIGHIWGWATWRDRWQQFDPLLPGSDEFREHNGFKRLFGLTNVADDVLQNVDRVNSGILDTWDCQWTLYHAMKGRMAAVPAFNLMDNIGFDATASHTHSRPDWLSGFVHTDVLTVTNPKLQVDREYEMSLLLSKKRNEVALPSSAHFLRKGSASDRPLHIVQINTTDKGGGAEAIAMLHHHRLLAKGQEATLLVAVRKAEATGVVEMSADVVGQLRTLKPDVLHVHNLHGTSLSIQNMAILCQEFPVLWTLHDAWLMSGSSRHPCSMDNSGESFLDREAFLNALTEKKRLLQAPTVRLTAPSQWLRNVVYGVHQVQAHHVPNQIVWPEAVAPIPSERPYLLFVANHADGNPYKDLSTLRSAWEVVATHHAIDLMCIGGTQQMHVHGMGTYRMLAHQPTEMVFSYMKGAVAVVQASKQENAPLTILEAHSVGTPVIGALVGGISEMVCPLEASLLYESGDVAALTTSILQAIALQKELRAEVRSCFANHTDMGAMSDTFVGHYLDMLHG